MIMEPLGINVGFLLVQLCGVLAWLGFIFISLFDLRKKRITGTALAVWVLIICAIPLIGPLAYWIVKPSAESNA
ncbi:MAG TPA: hypothetical protein VLE49_05725 [Anaerolineales bacterium]|nr:hypothetical protein [Anaerolineales bacterium]